MQVNTRNVQQGLQQIADNFNNKGINNVDISNIKLKNLYIGKDNQLHYSNTGWMARGRVRGADALRQATTDANIPREWVDAALGKVTTGKTVDLIHAGRSVPGPTHELSAYLAGKQGMLVKENDRIKLGPHDHGSPHRHSGLVHLKLRDGGLATFAMNVASPLATREPVYGPLAKFIETIPGGKDNIENISIYGRHINPNKKDPGDPLFCFKTTCRDMEGLYGVPVKGVIVTVDSRGHVGATSSELERSIDASYERQPTPFNFVVGRDGLTPHVLMADKDMMSVY